MGNLTWRENEKESVISLVLLIQENKIKEAYKLQSYRSKEYGLRIERGNLDS